jgi:putative inorganic carbon (HCO3(-)) transporter
MSWWKSKDMSIRDIVLLAAVGISLPFCFIRPIYGIVVWTILAFLNPQAFTWGIARDAPLAQAVAIPTIAGFLLKAQFKRLFCSEMFLLVVLWLWFTITTFNSSYTPEFAENAARTWFRWGFVSKILLMTVVSVGIVNSRAHLRWLVLAIGGSFALLVLHSLPGIILSGGEFRVYGPDNSMLANNNGFGLAVNMALPFLFCLARTESNRRLKLLLWTAFIAGIIVSFFTYSRGALVGLIAMAVFMMLLSNQKLMLIPVVLLACLFAAFVAPQKLRDRMSQTTDTTESSAQSRLNSWAYCWNVANAYPVTGGGFDAYTQALFDKYAPNPKDVHGPHSIYFGVLLEHGFVGFSLYFLLMAHCFVVLRRTSKRARRLGDEQSAHYADMLMFSLVGFLASGAFLGSTYFDFYFTIVACTAMLKRVCREEWAANVDPEADSEDSEEVLATTDLPAFSFTPHGV